MQPITWRQAEDDWDTPQSLLSGSQTPKTIILPCIDDNSPTIHENMATRDASYDASLRASRPYGFFSRTTNSCLFGLEGALKTTPRILVEHAREEQRRAVVVPEMLDDPPWACWGNHMQELKQASAPQPRPWLSYPRYSWLNGTIMLFPGPVQPSPLHLSSSRLSMRLYVRKAAVLRLCQGRAWKRGHHPRAPIYMRGERGRDFRGGIPKRYS